MQSCFIRVRLNAEWTLLTGLRSYGKPFHSAVGLAGTELIFFVEACMAPCFGFFIKSVLITGTSQHCVVFSFS